MVTVNLAIPGAFPAAGGLPPSPGKLDAEIRAALPPLPFVGLVQNAVNVAAEFTDPLTPGETGRLNGIAAAHIPDTPDETADRRLDGLFTAPFNALSFEIWFDQENRLRVLEGLPALPRVAYENQLKAIFRTL